VSSLDEKRRSDRERGPAQRPARPGLVPVSVEHEYIRKGALNLFAAVLALASGDKRGIRRGIDQKSDGENELTTGGATQI
jgi:hypothetical protein